jgi:hypothetical protein
MTDQPAQETATPSDPRIEAMEASIRALCERIEQMATLVQPAPINPIHIPVLPPRGANPIHQPYLPVRNRRFDAVLSVESYRLLDRSPSIRAEQVASLTSYANQIRPRLADSVFGGDPPLQVLSFLKQLVRVADQSFISEAVLLWIVDDFLRTPAKEAFRSQTLDSWPAAVHWLLSTYAPEPALEAAIRQLQISGQNYGESVRQYGHRLQLEAAALGSLLQISEVKSLFAQGLTNPVRSLFAANQPTHELEEFTPLSVLVGRAELLEMGTRLSSPAQPRFGSRTSPPRTKFLAASVESEPRPTEPPGHVLALSTRNSNISSDQWTCFVCYKRGHGWLECSWLSQVSETDKEDAILRRRSFMERFRSRSPRSSRSSSPIRPSYVPSSPKSENGQASPHQ